MTEAYGPCARERVKALPDASIYLEGELIEFGECVCELREAGTDREHVVIVRADKHVIASAELVRDWMTPDHPGVSWYFSSKLPIVCLGTACEGEGVVGYEIDRAALAAATQGKVDRVTLRRVE